jgi:hypothetical protein
MAKSRKKARKAAKRTVKKRRTMKAKARMPAKKKTRRAKRRKPVSVVEAVAGAVRETGELRSRLAGHNTFED